MLSFYFRKQSACDIQLGMLVMYAFCSQTCIENIDGWDSSFVVIYSLCSITLVVVLFEILKCNHDKNYGTEGVHFLRCKSPYSFTGNFILNFLNCYSPRMLFVK
jgi:uncharacterized sodium:solute symporter family permease YidK